MTINGQTENLSNETAQVTSAPVETPKSDFDEQVPKSKVNEIVHARTKESHQKGYEKGRSEALAELQRQSSQPQNQQQSYQPSQMGGMQAPSAEEIRKMITEQANQIRMEEEGRRIATDFVSKMQQGIAKYPDFEDKVAKLNLPNNLSILHLANATENAAEVVYELANNPHHVGTLLSLVNNPATAHLAVSEIHRLSSSIKTNQAASQVPNVKPPLSQVKNSTVGTDSGAMTIDDYRNQDWLRA